jgi:hypothetical protein
MKKIEVNEKAIKGIGIATTVLGAAITMISNWVQGKELDAKISEQVAKALTEQQTNI